MDRRVLTNRFVSSRKRAPPGERVEYHDATVPGLALRVTDKGSKSYVLIARYPSNPKNPTRRALGAAGALTLLQARNKAREWLDLINRGIDPKAEAAAAAAEAAKAAAEATTGTFAAIAERYLTEAGRRTTKRGQPWKPKTAKEWRRIFEHDVLPRWGARPLADIKKSDVLELVNEKAARRERKHRRRSDGAAVQAGKMLTRLRTFFRWAAADDLVRVDPTTGVRFPAREAQRDRYLDDDEIRAFWAGCEKLEFPFGPLFELLLLTAQRVGEVGEMQWSELDFDNRIWTIPGERAKNGKAHIVHLSNQGVEILESLPRVAAGDLPPRHVFSTNGRVPVSGFSRAKDRLDRYMADSPPWILHDLRRTATTGMARLNMAPHIVDKILNHTAGTIRGVAATYNRFEYLPERRTALETWGCYVESLVRPAAASATKLAAERMKRACPPAQGGTR